MATGKSKQENKLRDLINSAKELNVEVRTEKLLRDTGYRAQSGRCRVNGQDIILIDRSVPIQDQVEFLAAELAEFKKLASAPQIVETAPSDN